MSLASRCPDLTRIEVTTWNYRQCVPLAFTGPFPSSLQELSLDLYGDHALLLIWNLDCFPSLKAVSLTSQPSDPSCQCLISSIPASSGDFLGHAERLTLSMSISTATRVLTATTSETLEYLRLNITVPRDADLPSLASPFATSLERFSSTLHTLVLTINWHGRNTEIPTIIQPLAPLLDPLFSLHALVVLEIRLRGVSVYVSTQDLWSMARSWPRITRLEIRDEEALIEQEDQVTTVEVTSLLAFAMHCPSLEQLVLHPLYLTAANCALEGWRPSDSVSAPQLRRLEVSVVPRQGEVFGQSQIQLRPFLEATFPNAALVYSAWRALLVSRRSPDEFL
ncbi:hypothetical protein ACG7TL_006346 [Trametes sanguinea]